MKNTDAMESMLREWVGVRPTMTAAEALERFGVHCPLCQYERELVVLLQRAGNEARFIDLEDVNGRPWWYTAVAVELLVRRGLAIRKPDPDAGERGTEWMPGDDAVVHLVG